MSLNGQTLDQGSTQLITFTINDLTGDHALSPDGFNTNGYEMEFVAKQNLADADTATTTILIPNDRFVINSDSEAQLTLRSDDTSTLPITGTQKYEFQLWMRESVAPAANSYAVLRGNFSLRQSVKTS